MIATAFAVPVNFERFGSLFRLLSGTAGNKSENYAGSQLIRTQHWLLPSFWRSHPRRRRRHDAADSRLIRQPRCKRPRRRSPARAAGVERHLVDCQRGQPRRPPPHGLQRQSGDLRLKGTRNPSPIGVSTIPKSSGIVPWRLVPDCHECTAVGSVAGLHIRLLTFD